MSNAVLTDLELMRLHMEAEFTRNETGDLVSTNEPAANPAPRFFLGQTRLGVVRGYRHDVSKARRVALDAALEPSTTQLDRPLDPTPYERILSQDSPIRHSSVGLAFRFPPTVRDAPHTRVLRDSADAALLHPLLAAWAPDIHASAPLVALVPSGQAVAVCASVRITPPAHEAGVETAPPFRGRGYATAVVVTWAAAVRALGAEPLYSTTWQNTASRAVARALGLASIGRDLHVT